MGYSNRFFWLWILESSHQKKQFYFSFSLNAICFACFSCLFLFIFFAMKRLCWAHCCSEQFVTCFGLNIHFVSCKFYVVGNISTTNRIRRLLICCWRTFLRFTQKLHFLFSIIVSFVIYHKYTFLYYR